MMMVQLSGQIALSIIDGTGPGTVNCPGCCKRDAMIAFQNGIEYVNNNYGVNLEYVYNSYRSQIAEALGKHLMAIGNQKTLQERVK